MPNLVLRQFPLLARADRDEEENPIVLARDVSLFDLQFWGRDSRDWETGWLHTNQLPKLVKFTVGFGYQRGFSRRPREVAVRIVALPAMTVPRDWQRPNVALGAPGASNQPPVDPRLGQDPSMGRGIRANPRGPGGVVPPEGR